MALWGDRNRLFAGSAKVRWVAGAAFTGFAMVLAVPLIAQRTPTSLLPPGFGNEPAPPEQKKEEPDRASRAQPGAKANNDVKSALQLDLSGLAGSEQSSPSNTTEPLPTPEELAEQKRKYDLPARARRSLDQIGPLTPASGGLAANAFGKESGQFLTALMRNTKVPVASRWASILLRRTLLSSTRTPSDIDGADWAAERAWMLVRMGEADPARMMVQSVDADRYSKRLYAVAMQAYLASADPVGLCSIYEGAQDQSSSPSWRMAGAICASFSAEQGRASAILNQTQRRGDVRGIDYRLTEKMVGAGANSRRSVKIEWDGVARLTAWRFGLATATNVDIPAPLMAQAGDHVRAWQARAPMLSLATRLASVETAARLGVFSSAALVDFYSELRDGEDVPDRSADRIEALRRAYTGQTVGDRIGAMRSIWSGQGGQDFVGLLTISRAAAALPQTEVDGADFSHLIAAMLSAGYDKSAMRWATAKDALAQADGADGWAMLAVGAPQSPFAIDAERVRHYLTNNGRRGQMFIAGLAGLGRIGGADLDKALDGSGLAFQAHGRWEHAIDLAARRGEKGTVALLTATGLQVSSWDKVPPRHLYHIVSALHRAGLDPEARMIAAEAIMRS